MKKKLLLVAEFFAVCAVAGALGAGYNLGDNVTPKEAISAIATGATGAVYIAARLVAPFLITTLSDAKDALLKQITSSAPPPAA